MIMFHRFAVHLKKFLRYKPRIIAVIPVRLESQRLPRKALSDICGLPMIAHVFQRASLSQLVDHVYVATDSPDIHKVISDLGGTVIFTSSYHKCGTTRIAEACHTLSADIIVNVQGDEALLNPKHIDEVANALLSNSEADVALLSCEYTKPDSPSDIKVVSDLSNYALYFSRSSIPYPHASKSFIPRKAYHLVAFRRKFLLAYSKLVPTPLDSIESNEYLRILEHGYRIYVHHVDSSSISVDTREDLEFVRSKMPSDPVFSLYNGKS